MSPFPVRKMIGSAYPRTFISCCSSSPLIPGIRTSRIAQPGVEGVSSVRNERPFSYVFTRHPSEVSMNSSASRIAGSSSTVRMRHFALMSSEISGISVFVIFSLSLFLSDLRRRPLPKGRRPAYFFSSGRPSPGSPFLSLSPRRFRLSQSPLPDPPDLFHFLERIHPRGSYRPRPRSGDARKS